MNGRKLEFVIIVQKLIALAMSLVCTTTVVLAQGNSGWQKWPYEMNSARSQFTTTKMGNGKLLIAGGYDGNKGVTYSSAEIMDTTTGKSTLTGSMNEKRAGHTATLLNGGEVLVVGGYYYDSSSGSTDPIYVSKTEIFKPALMNWDFADLLEKARAGHTATLLNDGKVLVTGGYNIDDGQLADCRLFDPETSKWASAPDMYKRRTGHTANLLNDGKVLVAGGYNSKDGYLASSEIYDPATDTWKATGNMYAATAYHAAFSLPNGKILAVGGSNATGIAIATIQQYDPATDVWNFSCDMETPAMLMSGVYDDSGKLILGGGKSSLASYIGIVMTVTLNEPVFCQNTGTLKNPRAYNGAEYLGDGKVLFIGGQSADNLGYSKYLSKSEIYDILDRTTSSPGLMNESRTKHSSLLLDDESVFIAGGQNFNDKGEKNTEKSTETFNYKDGQWTSIKEMPEGRSRFKAIGLVDGKVLIIGGFATYESIANTTFSSCQIYDPETNQYTNAASMKTPRCDASAIRLTDGRVLVVGGVNIQGSEKTVLKSAEIYDPVENKWTEIPDINNARSDFTIRLFSGDDGRVLIGGGKGENGESLDSCQIYDPKKNVWLDAAPMSQRRAQFEMVPLKTYPLRYGAIGGKSDKYSNSEPRQGAEYSCEIYDSETDTWTNASSMLQNRYAHTATVLNDGRILVTGGYDDNRALSSAELYDPEKDEWTSAGNMTDARYNHTAILLPNGKVMICGGENGDALDTIELFDPTAAPISDGTIHKLSFSATYKDSLKKGNGGAYQKHCANKFTVQTAIAFGQDFNPDDIKEGDTFAVNFGDYSFSGTFGNTLDKSKVFKSKPGKGGIAKFANKVLDQVKNKQVVIEKIDVKWDAKGKLTVKVSGTPATDSTTNVTDLSGYKDGKNITGTIDVFTLTFGSHGSSFDEGSSLTFTGKKATKTVTKDQEYKLINWSAKGTDL